MRFASASTTSIPTLDVRGPYTDAPDLHPNLILGSLHLLFWLFFHPSAWHSYVERVSKNAPPNLRLGRRDEVRLQNQKLRWAIIQAYMILPFEFGLLITLFMILLDAANERMLGSVAGGLVFAAAFTLGIGAAHSKVSWLIGHLIRIESEQRKTNALLQAMGKTALFGLISVVVMFGGAFGITAIFSGGVLGALAIGILGGATVGVMVRLLVNDAPNGIAGFMVVATIGVVVVGIAGIVAIGITGIVTVDVAVGILLGILFSLDLAAVRYSVSLWFGGAIRAIGISIIWIMVYVAIGRANLWPGLPLSLIGVLIGFTLPLWRPIIFYPLLAAYNMILYRLDQRRSPGQPVLLRYHSAFWDEHQWLHLYGLEEYLVLVFERHPIEGRAAIEYLANSRQYRAAQDAQIELDARWLERCVDARAIGESYIHLAAGELEGPASALLRSFSRLAQDVDAALRQESAYNQRLALSAVEDRLDGLLRELTRSSERYAGRFRLVAIRWRQIVADHIHTLAAKVEQRQEIDSPYIIGIPLTEQQEVFVGRADISARIEQLLLDRRRPPLLLYGQRRMGKTSLLNNLGRLLPSTIVPLFVDLQGPVAQSSGHVGLLYNLGRGMAESAQRQRGLALPPLSRDSLAADPFTRFDEWLDEVEAALGQSAALLTLDEFEALDGAFNSGRFEEERVLGMLRNLIQHRPRFKVLLAGSHTLDELRRWASYLINVQMVRIDYLKEAETRQLVERPIKDYALRYEPDASQRVLDLTRGHPFLCSSCAPRSLRSKTSRNHPSAA